MAEEKKERFYITTAIPYMNAKLHLGQVYEFILADVMARYHRLLGEDTFFLTGSDEHGQKIFKSAAAKGVTQKEYVDDMVADMQRILKLYRISNDAFIRTTDAEHEQIVRNIYTKMYEKGDVYKKAYEGWYCVPCETFLMDSQLEEGKCPQCSRQAELVKEDNYFFRLSNYEAKLLKHIQDNPGFVVPETRRNEVIGLLKQGLNDFSISRTTVKWGVQIPFDSSQYSYVWVDALINYISALGYSTKNDGLFVKYWPANQQHVGKDILKFHAVIWPALLMSIGVAPPKQVIIHGWIMKGGEKLSKSKGITLDPDEMADEYGTDAIRYFFTREISFGNDGSFTAEAMQKRYNAELSNDYGNLVSRTLAMIEKYRDGVIPAKTAGDPNLKKLWEETKKSALIAILGFGYSDCLVTIWNFINAANKYIEDSRPWEAAKSAAPEDVKRLDEILYSLAECIRLSTILVFPFMPATAKKVFEQLGIIKDFDMDLSLAEYGNWGDFEGNTKTGKRDILFPRIENEKAI
jgi:methionyl-tRNA synthetase